MLRLFLAAAFVFLLAVCSDGSPAPATPTATVEAPAETVTPAPTPPPGVDVSPTPRPRLGARPFPAAEAENLRRLFAQTAQIRGLEPRGEVEKLLIGRRDAADYLVSTIEPDDERQIELQQRVYRLVGLVPPDADLLELQISLLRALVLGFYDPDEKALFVVDDIGINTPLARGTIVHEMVHALQDQYYDINATYESLLDDWDALAGYIHVLEGDARYHEMTFSGVQHPSTCSAVVPAAPLRNIPAVIQRELESPYSNGLCLVRVTAPRLPRGVDSLYDRLPATMEQVLHPEKYLANERPRKVDLSPLATALGSGWSEVASSTFGEFWWWNYLLLGLNDTRQVIEAGAGWGGDRWRLYASDEASLIHIGVVWDTEADARQFWQALIASLNGRSGSPRLDASAIAIAWQDRNAFLRASVLGNAVTLVISGDEAALSRAWDALAGSR